MALRRDRGPKTVNLTFVTAPVFAACANRGRLSAMSGFFVANTECSCIMDGTVVLLLKFREDNNLDIGV